MNLVEYYDTGIKLVGTEQEWTAGKPSVDFTNIQILVFKFFKLTGEATKLGMLKNMINACPNLVKVQAQKSDLTVIR